MFNPGDTVIHRFLIPFTIHETDIVYITYKQNGHVVLKKTAGAPTVSEDGTSMIQIEFTQRESLMFKDNTDCMAQINVTTSNGKRLSSREIPVKLGVQHYRAVIRNEQQIP